jgi:hypothetical protein
MRRARAVLAAKRVTDAPPKAVRDLFGAVQAALRNHKGGSVIEDTTAHPKGVTIWQLRNEIGGTNDIHLTLKDGGLDSRH